MDAGRTHFIGQRGEHLRCITPAQHDARTMRSQAARQTIERVMQPDPARPAIGMVPGPIVIQNIDRDDRTGLGGGVAIGGITLATAPDVIAAGAASVAVISDLLGGGDPARRVGEYLDALVESPTA